METLDEQKSGTANTTTMEGKDSQLAGTDAHESVDKDAVVGDVLGGEEEDKLADGDDNDVTVSVGGASDNADEERPIHGDGHDGVGNDVSVGGGASDNADEERPMIHGDGHDGVGNDVSVGGGANDDADDEERLGDGDEHNAVEADSSLVGMVDSMMESGIEMEPSDGDCFLLLSLCLQSRNVCPEVCVCVCVCIHVCVCVWRLSVCLSVCLSVSLASDSSETIQVAIIKLCTVTA